MAGCDGWITIKILELVLCIFCIIYKRVTDDEANKLFYFLQKYSREWPLLKNITWEENGAIFTDVTYGGFIIIVIGLIIGQASGELQHHRKTENFFLIMGALMFIATGSLELAALDSVEERLVDNAAILGVVSLLTGLLFILDLLLAGKRRKKARLTTVRKTTAPKMTQTDDTKLMEVYRSSDMNGNVQNGGYYQGSDVANKKIPRNGVKILPSSPTLEEIDPAPPMYSVTDLKTAEGRIRSTESFLRSEKGEYGRRSTTPKEQFYVPPGYALVPVDVKSEGSKRNSGTPPGYASVITDLKSRPVRTPPGYVVVPIDQIDTKSEDGRKLQSPTITTTLKNPDGYYREDSSMGRTPQASLTNLSLSDLSDVDDSKRKPVLLKKPGKYSPEYPDSRGIVYNDRADSRLSHKSLQDFTYLPKGRLNHGYEDDYSGGYFRRNSSSRSSKPKSILRFDRIRTSKKEEDDGRFDSLDSRKIADDLRHLREITKSDLDLTHDLENENEILKRRLRKEKEESEKLKQDLQKRIDQNLRESQRKKLEERINELEDMDKLMKLEKKVRDLEEKKMREREEEKDRRVSEREEQYFGILDLKQSHRETSPVARRKMSDIEHSMRSEGAKKVNEKLKEKIQEQVDMVRDDQEMRKVIDEGFYFLDEEEKRKRRARKMGKTPSPNGSDASPVSHTTDEEIRIRMDTPGGSSYKSEAQVWLGSDGDLRKEIGSTPASPGDPGFVLHTVQNWPETPSPDDRFRFSAKKAQHLKISKTPSPETGDEDEDDRKSDVFPKRGVITRRVDFSEVPIDELRRPATVIGSTSTWRKWLQPKPKFQFTKSAP